jgi:hypothetical protein
MKTMIITDTKLPVTLTNVHWKKDSEGGKWATVRLSMKVESADILRAPLIQGYKLMKNDLAFDALTTEQKMDNVQIEFRNGAGAGAKTVFDPPALYGFTFNREKATQTGTLKKDRGAGVELSFAFTVPLGKSGSWLVENFGDSLSMTIFRVQGELPIADPNAIADSLAADPSPEMAPERRKRGRPKKSS